MKWLERVVLIMVFMGYSVAVFAYLNANYPNMPMFNMLCDHLKSIESKIDTLIWLERGKK